MSEQIICPLCGRPYSPRWSPCHEERCPEIQRRLRDLELRQRHHQLVEARARAFDTEHAGIENAWRRFNAYRFHDARATGDWRVDLAAWLETLRGEV